MIAFLICLASLAALLQFFISYARALVTSYKDVDVSDCVQTLAEVQDAGIGADEFPRLRQLASLCPSRKNDRLAIQWVSAYYDLLNWGRTILKPFAGVVARLEGERMGCTHFAAVALDRRIKHSRSMLEQLPGI